MCPIRIDSSDFSYSISFYLNRNPCIEYSDIQIGIHLVIRIIRIYGFALYILKMI